jgi:DNA-binding PadR family transcriptional regulator
MNHPHELDAHRGDRDAPRGGAHFRGHERRRHDSFDAPHHHPHGPGPHISGGGRRGRAQRGDVRAATLLLLAEAPMHGYQLMQAIAERSGGAWRPSPGAVYPTIAQLEDEGLVRTTVEGGRKLVTLTDAGQSHVTEQAEALGNPFAVPAGRTASGTDLRAALEEIHGAARQLARIGSDTQLRAAREVLTEARRTLYRILADDPEVLRIADTDPADTDGGAPTDKTAQS